MSGAVKGGQDAASATSNSSARRRIPQPPHVGGEPGAGWRLDLFQPLLHCCKTDWPVCRLPSRDRAVSHVEFLLRSGDPAPFRGRCGARATVAAQPAQDHRPRTPTAPGSKKPPGPKLGRFPADGKFYSLVTGIDVVGASSSTCPWRTVSSPPNSWARYLWVPSRSSRMASWAAGGRVCRISRTRA